MNATKGMHEQKDNRRNETPRIHETTIWVKVLFFAHKNIRSFLLPNYTTKYVLPYTIKFKHKIEIGYFSMFN